MLTVQAHGKLASNVHIDAKNSAEYIIIGEAQIFGPQDPPRFLSDHREETQQRQRRLASPGHLWAESEEVSEEESLRGETRHIDEAFTRTPSLQYPYAGASSITSSRTPSPVDMDAVAQLIGYSESDSEKESDSDLGLQRTSPSPGIGPPLEAPHAIATRSRPPMAYPKRADTEKRMKDLRRHDGSLQRREATAPTAPKDEARPRKRRHNFLYQSSSSSDEDVPAASGKNLQGSDNEKDDGSAQATSKTSKEYPLVASNQTPSRVAREDSIQAPPQAPPKAPRQMTVEASSQRIQKGKLDQARLQQAMARSQQAKYGKKATMNPASTTSGYRTKSSGGAASSTGTGDRSLREDASMSKSSLPSSLRANSSNRATQMNRSTLPGSSNNVARARPQHDSQAEFLNASSRPGTPIDQETVKRTERRASISMSAGPSPPDRPSQMRASPLPPAFARAPTPNRAMDSKPSSSLSKTARDMLRAKLQSTKHRAPSQPRAAPTINDGNDDTKPSPHLLSNKINGLPLVDSPFQPTTTTNNLRKPVPSAPSARNKLAPPSTSSAVQNLLTEISTDGNAASNNRAKKTASISGNSAKSERDAPVSRHNSGAIFPDSRSSSRLSTTITTSAPSIPPETLQGTSSVIKADSKTPPYTGTATLRSTGRGARQPGPSSISQQIPEKPSSAQQRSVRARPKAVPPLQPRASFHTTPQALPASQAKLSGSDVSPTPAAPPQPRSSPAASPNAPAPTRPPSQIKPSAAQEKAPSHTLSTHTNTHTDQSAPDPLPTVPTKPAPANGRPKSHVRVPSGPSDFDVFIPPVPGAPEPVSGGGEPGSNVQLEGIASASRPNDGTEKRSSTAVKGEESRSAASKGCATGAEGPTEKNGPADKVQRTEKLTTKTEESPLQEEYGGSGVVDGDKTLRGSGQDTTVHGLREKAYVPASGTHDEGKNMAAGNANEHKLEGASTGKENEKASERTSMKKEASSVPRKAEAAPVEREKRPRNPRGSARTARKSATAVPDSGSTKAVTITAPDPPIKVTEVVQDLSTIISKERATALSSLEPHFSYRIKQKIWPDSGSEGNASTTQVGFSSTVLETANKHAEEVFTQIKHQYTCTFPVQHHKSTSSHNDDGCLELEGTLASIAWPVKQVFVKVWVERGIVPSEVVAFNPPEQHTPYLSKTLYILRLFKLVKDPEAGGETALEQGEAQEEVDKDGGHVDGASSSDSAEDSEPEAANDPDKGKHYKKRQARKALKDSPRPKRRKLAATSTSRQQQGKTGTTPPPKGFIRGHHEMPCPQVYTTLFAANNAACNLQIEMISDKTLLGKAKQEELNAKLRKKMVGLESKEGTERYWHSEFPVGFGSSKFELVVEKVNLCGPRNV